MDADPRAQTTSFDSVFSVTSRIEMQEGNEVILVEPEVSVDPLGGFLLGDRREARVVRYGDDGSLLWHAGGKGDGPSEFRSVTAVRRLVSGHIVAADFSGRISIFAAGGDSLISTHQSDFHQLEELEPLDDSTVLVSALYGNGIDVPRLHTWNVRRKEVIRSFFQPLSASPNRDAAVMAGWTRFDLRGDTIAAIFATSDTVYLFTTDGSLIDRLPLPSNHFRRVQADLSLRRGTDPREAARFLSSFDLVADVHWTDGGDLVIPYQQVDPTRALDRIWHLIIFDYTRDQAVEMRGVPRLITLDSAKDRFIFMDPNGRWPNQWIESSTTGLHW